MALTIPNVASAYYPGQAAPDNTDIAAMVAATSGTGVITNCLINPWFSTQVICLGGTINAAGVVVTVSVLNMTVTAGDATFDRKDIVVASSGGTPSIVNGTAAATPVKPAIPAGSVLLAELYIPHGFVPGMTANEIVDKRCFVPQPYAWVGKTANYTALAGDYVQADSSGGSITITLPSLPATGTEVTVMKSDASGYPVYVVPNTGGFPTIDNDTAGVELVGANTGITVWHRAANIWLIKATKP